MEATIGEGIGLDFNSVSNAGGVLYNMPPTPTTTTTVGTSTMEDYGNVMNSGGMLWNHPELYSNTKVEPFVEEDYTFVGTLNQNERTAFLGASNRQDAYNRVERVREYDKSLQRINLDSIGEQLLYGAIAGSVDPINFIPVAGATAKLAGITKAATTLGRIASTGVAVGTVAAVSNVASEALIAEQGMPHDYMTSAFFGFALGGTLGALSEGLTGINRVEVAKTIVGKDDIVEATNIDKKLLDNSKVDIEADDVQRVNRSVIPTFLQSDVTITASSELDSIVRISNMLDIPSIKTKGAIGTTVRDYTKSVLDGELHVAQIELHDLFNKLKADPKSNVNGKFDEFLEQTGRDFNIKAGEQEIAVKLDSDYIQATKDYNNEVAKLKREITKAKEGLGKHKDKEAIKELDSKYKEAKTAIRKMFNDKTVPIWTKYKPELGEAEGTMFKYFNGMLGRGQELGVKELEGISRDRLHMPRQWNFGKIKAMDKEVVLNMLEQGIIKHPDNARFVKKRKTRQAAENMYDSLSTRGFDANFNDGSFIATMNVKSLKDRKIHINNKDVVDLLQNSAIDNMGGYHYFTSKSIAMRKVFPELRGVETKDLTKVLDEQYIQPIRQEAIDKGINPDTIEAELKALDRMFQDSIGYLRIPENGQGGWWRTSRIATQANATVLSGWFGLNQVLEIPSALWATGYNRIFHKQFGTIMKDVVKSLWKDGSPDSMFAKEMLRAGYFTSLIESHGINRMVDTATVFNIHGFENTLHNVNNKLYKYNGMRAMTAWLEGIVASNSVTKIVNATEVDDLLTKWGFTNESLKVVQAELKRVGDITPDGTINKLGLDDMEDTAREYLGRAMSRAIEEGVIQGDTMKLPSWMVIPGPLKNVIFQFLRFPIAAQEVLLRKGVNDDMAGWTASVIGAAMMSIGMRYLIEQAEIATGAKHEVDAKYDITTEEGMKNASLKSLNYVAGFGGLNIPYHYMTTFLQQPEIGKDYASKDVAEGMLGVSASRFQATSNILSAIAEGKIDDREAWRDLQTFYTPLSNIPILGAYQKQIIDELTIRYKD